MDSEFYNRVVELLPSKDLKACIAERGFTFGEKELLKIILEYAPTLDTRLELFRDAATAMGDKNMRALAKMRFDFENKRYAEFLRSDPDCVYEIEIDLPRAVTTERYITKTFDDALKLIKKFLKCFRLAARDTVGGRYTVTKKSTVVPDDPQDVTAVGTVGYCVLDERRRVLDVDMCEFDCEVACRKGTTCDDCRMCIGMTELSMPCFAEKFGLVAFYDDILRKPHKLTYGIFMCDDGFASDPLVLTVTPHGDGFKVDGAHPALATVIIPERKAVPEKIYAGYLAAVENLKSNT